LWGATSGELLNSLNGLTERVVTPESSDWLSASRGFAARCDYDDEPPMGIVFARSTEDVIRAVWWARSNGVVVRPRGGRHCYQGYSSLNPGGIIVDLSQMDRVEVDLVNGLAVADAGINMLKLSSTLGECGVCVPLATGPTVGLAGLVQGGGFGMTSRRFGLTCDNVTRMDLVTANGELVTASQEKNPDLFWALRGGGGGNFGIVTSVHIRVFPVETVAFFRFEWCWADFLSVVSCWMEWNSRADRGITSLLSAHADGTLIVEGQFTPETGQMEEFDRAIAPLIRHSKPADYQFQELPFDLASRIAFSEPREGGQLFKSSSSVAMAPIPNEGLQVLKECLESVPPLSEPPSQTSMIQLLGGGGRPAEIAPDATAVYWRDAHAILQYNGYWTASEDAQPTIDWVVNARRAMLPYTRGAYVNYQDDQLGSDWLEQYYGKNLPRLIEVKTKFDPDNLLAFPQGIPVAAKPT
jgi:FAD/FMN-containing dehydrogenase